MKNIQDVLIDLLNESSHFVMNKDFKKFLKDLICRVNPRLYLNWKSSHLVEEKLFDIMQDDRDKGYGEESMEKIRAFIEKHEIPR